MGTIGLDKIFSPKSIAVIGASDRPGSIGCALLRNLIGTGFDGVVYPVNPRRDSLLGVEAYPSIHRVPRKVDLAIIATPASTTPEIVEDCGKAGVGGLIVISAGFKEIGEKGRGLEEKILETSRRYGMRVVGPNCLGVIRPSIHLNASFARKMPKPGKIAFISQSGALCSSILDFSIRENIGFSNFVSIGSMLDVDFGDLIDYFGSDPKTESIILYIESLTNARKFMSAARGFAKTKPIIAVKSGKSAEGTRAASTHTGALAGDDVVYDAALKRAGIVRVDEIEDLFDCSEILAKQPIPRGPNLAIITNAGGAGVMATDALISLGGKLALLSEKTVGELNKFLPEFWSRGNPIDILGDAPTERFGTTLKICLEDENVDGALVILTPQGAADPGDVAKAVVVASKGSGKPVLASWMGADDVFEGRNILRKTNIPEYPTPEQAVKAFLYMYQYGRNIELLHEVPKYIPIGTPTQKEEWKEFLREVNSRGREVLTESESKSLLESYGVPTTKPHLAKTLQEAISLASKIGYPVVLKIQSPQITHKTEAGGVILDVRSEEDVRKAFKAMMSSAKKYRPDAQIEGVTLQPMRKGGYEVIIGSKKDDTFGAVILFGMGGVATELYKDMAVGLPPLNQTLAKRLMESTKVYELLKGFRNRPPVNLERLVEILLKFSNLVVDFPEIKEVDVNPLIIDENDAVAADARVVIDKEVISAGVVPHRHLVISPYPTEYTGTWRLKNGEPVVLRPIRPEDEPMVLELFYTFSEETMYSVPFQRYYRVFQPIGSIIRGILTRFCQNDYDREITIGAEVEEDGRKKLAGLSKLTADADRENAEFALIVGDPWQGLGLGSKLLDYAIDIARGLGIKTIYSEVNPFDLRAIDFFKGKGFEVKEDLAEGLRYVTLKL